MSEDLQLLWQLDLLREGDVIRTEAYFGCLMAVGAREGVLRIKGGRPYIVTRSDKLSSLSLFVGKCEEITTIQGESYVDFAARARAALDEYSELSSLPLDDTLISHESFASLLLRSGLVAEGERIYRGGGEYEYVTAETRFDHLPTTAMVGVSKLRYLASRLRAYIRIRTTTPFVPRHDDDFPPAVASPGDMARQLCVSQAWEHKSIQAVYHAWNRWGRFIAVSLFEFSGELSIPETLGEYPVLVFVATELEGVLSDSRRQTSDKVRTPLPPATETDDRESETDDRVSWPDDPDWRGRVLGNDLEGRRVIDRHGDRWWREHSQIRAIVPGALERTVVILVTIKGAIPCGERMFPREQDGVRLIIDEGYFSPQLGLSGHYEPLFPGASIQRLETEAEVDERRRREPESENRQLFVKGTIGARAVIIDEDGTRADVIVTAGHTAGEVDSEITHEKRLIGKTILRCTRDEVRAEGSEAGVAAAESERSGSRPERSEEGRYGIDVGIISVERDELCRSPHQEITMFTIGRPPRIQVSLRDLLLSSVSQPHEISEETVDTLLSSQMTVLPPEIVEAVAGERRTRSECCFFGATSGGRSLKLFSTSADVCYDKRRGLELHHMILFNKATEGGDSGSVVYCLDPLGVIGIVSGALNTADHGKYTVASHAAPCFGETTVFGSAVMFRSLADEF
jgi:hypothetical protein